MLREGKPLEESIGMAMARGFNSGLEPNRDRNLPGDNNGMHMANTPQLLQKLESVASSLRANGITGPNESDLYETCGVIDGLRAAVYVAWGPQSSTADAEQFKRRGRGAEENPQMAFDQRGWFERLNGAERDRC